MQEWQRKMIWEMNRRFLCRQYTNFQDVRKNHCRYTIQTIHVQRFLDRGKLQKELYCRMLFEAAGGILREKVSGRVLKWEQEWG